MQTNKIKQYAPKARTDFIKTITKKANQLGVYQDKISDTIEVGVHFKLKENPLNRHLKICYPININWLQTY